jgi:hypothetical protein
MNQAKSCPIAESTAQIQIPKEHQWDPNLEFELGGGKATHVDGVEVLHRIVVTLLRPFDRVGTGIESFFSWKCLEHLFINLIHFRIPGT